MNVLQVGVLASGRPFIVMPYHAKDSLEVLIRRHGPLDWGETLTIGVKLAGALEAAHRAGTLHRDVKPGNILLTDYGEPQLTDFGIARIAGGFETATGVITGSPAFTAREVLEGASPTPASDV
jgi:serine/threonine-protein kinase PknK